MYSAVIGGSGTTLLGGSWILDQDDDRGEISALYFSVCISNGA